MLKFFERSDVSERLWILAFFLIAIGGFFAFVALTKNMNFMPGVLFAAAGFGLIAAGYPTNIPTDPPHIGLLTVYGERKPVLLESGDHLLADFWPLELGKIDIEITRVNYEFEFDATCKSSSEPNANGERVGGRVIVKVELTIEPDYHAEDKHGHDVGAQRMFDFLDSGRMEGVKNILEGVIKEAVRDTALSFTWEEFIFLKLPLSAQLVTMVADTRVLMLPRVNGRVPSATVLAEKPHNITPATYEKFPDDKKVDDVIEYYRHPDRFLTLPQLPADATDEQKQANLKKEQREIEKEIQFFLQVMVANGLGDVRKLGVKITRLNIARITGDPVMTEAANKAAAEGQERLAEERDGETELTLAKKLVTASEVDGKPTMSLEAAINAVQTRRGIAKKVVVVSSGNGLLDAAALLNSGTKVN